MRGPRTSAAPSDPTVAPGPSHASRIVGFDGPAELPDSVCDELWRILEDEAERQQSEE